jgi:hypothetical protein
MRQAVNSADGMQGRKHMRLLRWRPLRKGKVLGIATIELPEGLQIAEVLVCVGADGPWVSLPNRPRLDRSGQQMRNSADGKPIYDHVLSWRSRRLAQAFSRRVVELVRASHPDDLN